MDNKQVARRMRYGTVALLIIATAFILLALVLGIRELGSSVPGGLAVIAIALIGLGAVSWRLRVQWERIHS